MSKKHRNELQDHIASVLGIIARADHPGDIEDGGKSIIRSAVVLVGGLALDLNRIADALEVGAGANAPAFDFVGKGREFTLSALGVGVIRDALEIAYADADAPIFEDNDRTITLKRLAVLFGTRHALGGGKIEASS